jgi:prophage DNA circulation protein
MALTTLETILIALLCAETAVAVAVVAAIRPSRQAFQYLNELTERINRELIEVKRENRALQEQIGELKTLVAVLIAENGPAGPERQRLVDEAKSRISAGRSAIELVKEGKLMQAMHRLAYEVGQDELDEVIQLTGRLAGLKRSMDAGKIPLDHYEQELAKIRGAAISLAIKSEADGRA